MEMESELARKDAANTRVSSVKLAYSVYIEYYCLRVSINQDKLKTVWSELYHDAYQEPVTKKMEEGPRNVHTQTEPYKLPQPEGHLKNL